MIYVKSALNDGGEVSASELRINGTKNEVLGELLLVILAILKKEVVDFDKLKNGIERLFENDKDIEFEEYGMEDSNG